MSWLARALILLVAAAHLGFLVLEMFLWTKPAGRTTFGLSREDAETTRTLAANQGLYNGFIAAGLLWSALANRREIAVFFLVCVIVAGIYGAITVNRRVFYVQAVPALIALLLAVI